MKITIFPPAVVSYADCLPGDIAGQAHGPIVRIKPNYQEDDGLREHELTHVWQWWMTLGLHPLLYAFCKPYRLWAEVRAYREQMRHPDRNGKLLTIEQAAGLLMLPRYEFNLTAAEALAAIQSGGR